MPLPTVIGLMATVCTSLANVPQVISLYRKKSAKDISLGTFSILVVGLSLWLSYGILLSDVILVVANAISLTLSSTILIMKIVYDQSTVKRHFWDMGFKRSSTMELMSNDGSTLPVSTSVRSSELNNANV